MIKRWFFSKFKGEIELAIEALEWDRVQAEGDKIAEAAKAPLGSFSAQLEALAHPLDRQRFYNEHKREIDQEHGERREVLGRLKSEQRFGAPNGETSTL